jgi:hypothetical protein
MDAGGYGAAAQDDDDDEGHRGHAHKHAPRLPWRDVWILVAGMLLPLALNMEHGH